VLNRTTIRNLTIQDLTQVAGGTDAGTRACRTVDCPTADDLNP
jgi:hypothetical protein